MLKLIRWVLVAPLAVAAWLLAFVGALALHSLIDTYCPEQYLVSNTCSWEWAVLAQNVLIVVGASISAVLFVAVATVVAPGHKTRVAATAYLVGLSAASWMVAETGAWAAFAAAAATGLVTLWLIARKRPRRGYGEFQQRSLFV